MAKRTSVDSQHSSVRGSKQVTGTGLKAALVIPSERGSNQTRNTTLNPDMNSNSGLGLRTQSSAEKLTFKMLRGI